MRWLAQTTYTWFRLSLSRRPPRNLAGFGLKWKRASPRSRKYPSFFGHPPRTRDIAPQSSWRNNRFFGFSAQPPLLRLNAHLQADLEGSEIWQQVSLLLGLTSLRRKISCRVSDVTEMENLLSGLSQPPSNAVRYPNTLFHILYLFGSPKKGCFS